MARDKSRSLLWKLNNRCTTCGRPAKQREDGTFYSVCEVCYNRAKFANERKAKGHKDFDRTMTLCWSCQNAVPDFKRGCGCSWSNYFKPVEGWKAIETEISVQNAKRRSYIVIECPMYKKDGEGDAEDKH